MKLFAVWRLSILVFLLWIWSCAAPPRAVNPYFEMLPEPLLIAERELFSLALQQQKNNKLIKFFYKYYFGSSENIFVGGNMSNIKHDLRFVELKILKCQEAYSARS